MKTVEQKSPVKYSPRRQSRWMLADYGGKDLRKWWVLSLEWNSECVMDGESGDWWWAGGRRILESVTSSAEWYMLLTVASLCIVLLSYRLAWEVVFVPVRWYCALCAQSVDRCVNGSGSGVQDGKTSGYFLTSAVLLPLSPASTFCL